MITETDAHNSLEFADYYVILPSVGLWDVDRYVEQFEGRRCPNGFSYNSGTNPQWLTITQLQEMIWKHVDPEFRITSGHPPTEGKHTLSLKGMRRDLEAVLAELS